VAGESGHWGRGRKNLGTVRDLVSLMTRTDPARIGVRVIR
jgi:hypothetical protein